MSKLWKIVQQNPNLKARFRRSKLQLLLILLSSLLFLQEWARRISRSRSPILFQRQCHVDLRLKRKRTWWPWLPATASRRQTTKSLSTKPCQSSTMKTTGKVRTRLTESRSSNQRSLETSKICSIWMSRFNRLLISSLDLIRTWFLPRRYRRARAEPQLPWVPPLNARCSKLQVKLLTLST